MRFTRPAVVWCALVCVFAFASAHAQTFDEGGYWTGGFKTDDPPHSGHAVLQTGEFTLAGNVLTGQFKTSDDEDPSTIPLTITFDSVTPLGDGYLHLTGTNHHGHAVDSMAALSSLGTVEVTRDPVATGEIALRVVAHRAENPSLLELGGNWNIISLFAEIDQDGASIDGDHGVVVLAPTSETSGTGTHTSIDSGEPSTDFAMTLDRAKAKLYVSGPDVHVPGYVAVIDNDMLMHVDLGDGPAAPSEDPEHRQLGFEFLFRQRGDRVLGEAVGRWNLQGVGMDPNLTDWNSYWGTMDVSADGTVGVNFEGDAMNYRPGGWTATANVTMSPDGWMTVRRDGDTEEDFAVGMINTAGDTIVLGSRNADGYTEFYIATRALVPEPACLILVFSSAIVLFGARGRRAV